MITKKIFIPIYGYKLHYVEVEGKEDLVPVLRYFNRLHLDYENLQEIKSRIENEDIGGATTFHRKGDCTLMIILYPQSSEERKRECIAHEKRHCEDFILEHLNIEDMEAAAYLAGWLTTQLP